MLSDLLRDDEGDFSPSSLLGSGAPDAQPGQGQMRSYLSQLAGAYGLPDALVHATAQTESGFDASKTSSENNGDFDRDHSYGLMQVSDSDIGKTVRAPDGTPFQIGPDVKTDWRTNARAGVGMLAQHYGVAEMENPFGGEQELSQQAYSAYSAGNPYRGRYEQTLAYNGLPAHPDDRAFLFNYRQAQSGVSGRSNGASSQVPQPSQGATKQPSQTAATTAVPQQPPSSPACADDPECVNIKLKVIYDAEANDGNGLTQEQKRRFEEQLKRTQDQYGPAKIHFDVQYTPGRYISPRLPVQGLRSDAANVIVSDETPNGYPAVSQQSGPFAMTQIDVRKSDPDTLSHELAHHITGDTTGLINRIAHQDDSGIVRDIGNAFFDVINDMAMYGMSQYAPRPRMGRGQRPDSSLRPESVAARFNLGARQFQQRLSQQGLQRTP